MNQILLAWFLCSAFFGQTLLNQVTKDPDKPGRKWKVLVKKLLLGLAIIKWYFPRYQQLPLAFNESIWSRKWQLLSQVSNCEDIAIANQSKVGLYLIMERHMPSNLALLLNSRFLKPMSNSWKKCYRLREIERDILFGYLSNVFADSSTLKIYQSVSYLWSRLHF